MLREQPKYKGIDTIAPESYTASISSGFPLFLAVHLDGPCNIKCRKCGTEDLPHTSQLTRQYRNEVLREFSGLGGRTVLIFGYNEPLLSQDLPATVDAAYDNGLATVVFSNATRLTVDKAHSLHDRGVSLILSVDSMQRATYDALIERGEYDNAMRGIENALEAGFAADAPGYTRLAINTVIMRPNLEEIPEIARFAAEHNIRFFLDRLFKVERASANWDLLFVDRPDVRQALEPIGLYPVEEFFIKIGGCILIRYGTTLMPDGTVKPCPDSREVIGNVTTEALETLVRKQRELYRGCQTCLLPKGEK